MITAISTIQIVKEFVRISQENDLEALTYLLDEAGEFNILDDQNQTLEVGKEEFIQWYGAKLLSNTIHTVEFDKCNSCVLGGNVVIFNGGFFPCINTDIESKEKTGLLIESKNDLIHNIAFCFLFQKKENKYLFQLKYEKGL